MLVLRGNILEGIVMEKLSLEIPMCIFAAGCIICVLSALGSAWHIINDATVHTLYISGISIGIVGILVTGIIFARNKMIKTRER